VQAALSADGLAVQSFPGAFLNEPGRVTNGSGAAYRVFTPYWRAAQAAVGPVRLQPAPEALPPPKAWPASEPLDAWGLHPRRPDWSTGFGDWSPGEAGAAARLDSFLEQSFAAYKRARDMPAEAGGTRLSPHLAWGEIGPRQIWCAAHGAVDREQAGEEARDKLLSEVAWRDFNWQLLATHPELAEQPFRRDFERFPFRTAPAELEAWRRGRTGYPLVDAGLRQLWVTGWMHNRVRMVAASFLVKHLLIDWREGERWFWDTLVDADPANNALNWQWIAGSGPDAQPFHRIFNPVIQAEKFDPEGAYVRRWVPELAALPDAFLHRPWEAPADVLGAAGVRLGESYPRPIVDHAQARARALEAFASLRERAA
jgi:deoxyribodipyrimidine photo-lyase